MPRSIIRSPAGAAMIAYDDDSALMLIVILASLPLLLLCVIRAVGRCPRRRTIHRSR